MTNKVLLGLIVALAIGVVVVGSTDKARQQPAAAITAVTEKDSSTASVEVTAQDIEKTATDSKDLSIFVTAAQAVDITELLQEKGGTYTIFAPTNTAFEKYTGGDEKMLLSSKSKESLTDLLRYHIVAGQQELKGDGVLDTLQGGQIMITYGKDGTVYVNGVATVLSTEQTVGGSVVYIIDQVLTPKDAVGGTPNPVDEREVRQWRRLCEENGDGTVTIQDQTRDRVWGFLWWGSWENLGEQQTGFSSTGCHPFQGFTGQLGVTVGRTFGEQNDEGLNMSKEKELVKRTVCTENEDGTSTIQDQVQSTFIFWTMWSNDGDAEIQKTSC